MRQSLEVRLAASNETRSLSFRRWPVEADADTVGAVLIAHGLAEHGGRYAQVAADLNEQGFCVYAIDHLGHGHSPGRRCHLERFSDYLDGMDALCARARSDYPDLPMLLLGHSMGGLIAAAWLIDRRPDIAACALSGAAIMPPKQPPVWMVWLNRFLSWVRPSLGVLQLDADGVSRDPNVVERYENDPLVHRGKVSARLACELFDTMAMVRGRAGEIRIPTAVLHGGADRLTSPKGSRFLHEHIGSDHKDLIIYPELFHEIMNEPERETVMAVVIGWFLRHIPAKMGVP